MIEVSFSVQRRRDTNINCDGFPDDDREFAKQCATFRVARSALIIPQTVSAGNYINRKMDFSFASRPGIQALIQIRHQPLGGHLLSFLLSLWLVYAHGIHRGAWGLAKTKGAGAMLS